jgi:Regulator of Vps4 activity in the MVB pathway
MFDNFSRGFNVPKLKSHLKMAAGRLEIDSAKKTALMKQNMREVAELLNESPTKEEKARLRTEALIRDDNTLVAYDILRLECLLLMERVSYMNHCHECPTDLSGCVSDLIFAAPWTGIKEMKSVRKQFRRKWGRAFKMRAMTNEGGILNPKVVQNLSNQPSTKQTVDLYMEKICRQYDVDWTPTIELTGHDVIADEPNSNIPVTTGMMETDSEIKKMRSLGNLDVMQPPLVVLGNKGDATSVTSSSSSSNGDGDGDEPPPMAVAIPFVTRH